jgi:hypothetical protein
MGHRTEFVQPFVGDIGIELLDAPFVVVVKGGGENPVAYAVEHARVGDLRVHGWVELATGLGEQAVRPVEVRVVVVYVDAGAGVVDPRPQDPERYGRHLQPLPRHVHE